MDNKGIREDMKSIKSNIGKVFADVGRNHGYTITWGSGSFDTEGNFTIKIKGTREGALSPEALLYEDWRGYLGDKLPPLHTRLKYAGGVYTITGMKRGGKSVIGEAGLNRYKLPIETVKLYWEKQQREEPSAVPVLA